MDEITIFERLDDLHVMITCDDQGEYWFWKNTDTNERSEWECSNLRDAVIEAAKDFYIL